MNVEISKIIAQGNMELIKEKPQPVSLCPLQYSHGLMALNISLHSKP
jgi:hypothetical protein